MAVNHIQSHKRDENDKLAASVLPIDGDKEVFIAARIVTGGFALQLYGYSLAELAKLGYMLVDAVVQARPEYEALCQKRAEQEGRGEATVAGA